MVEFDTFRQDLATSLLRCAERRRQSRVAGVLTGEDIKVIALLERLASDVTNLDLHVFLVFELMFTHKRLARRYLRRHDDLLGQLGVSYCPTSATDLVRWLTHHTLDDASVGDAPSPPTRPAIAVRPRPTTRGAGRHDPREGGRQAMSRSLAVDLAAGFGIVAPCLALWHVWAAVGQMNDRAFMAAHPSVPATVVAVSPVTAARSSSLATDVVLAFRQPSGEACTATWHTGIPAFTGAPGDTVMVVPRASCELPLVPAAVGDPMQTLALAAALMAGGLAALRVWAWLGRRPPRRAAPPVWRPGQRHDLA